MTAIFESYAYGVIFGAVLLDTLGLPVPGEVVLLAAGFLVSSGKVQFVPAVLLAAAGAVLGDSLTYWLGRRVGVAGERQLVRLYCTWTACTLGSAHCVEQAEGLLRRFRGRVVFMAKFIAGARVFVPPVAGASALSFGRFVFFDATGSLLWIILVMGIGALLGREWEATARKLEVTYRFLGVVLVVFLGGYFTWKLARRRRYGVPTQGGEGNMAGQVQVTLDIHGMTCDNCARHVESALRKVTGVEDVRVPTWQTGRATVIADTGVTDDTLAQEVEAAGYRARVRERRELPEGKRLPSGGEDFDLMVIGGGSAAFAAAIKGAELGAKVAIVEAATIGGTCVNIGCVPSKTLIKAAELCYKSAYPQFEGLTACPPPSDWQRVVQQKDELVTALRQGKYVDVMKVYPTITLIRGRAKLTGPKTVTVNGTAYSPGKILLATGSLPWAPPIPGLAEAGYLDSTQALSLPKLPASLLVIGAGAIGLELGQLFARFGVRVMILEGGPHVAGAEEPEIGKVLTEYLADEKIRICTNVKITRVERAGREYRAHAEIDGKPETCAAEQLLVATGRRPNTADLGLAKAGVRTGSRGEIVVDEHLQTASPGIYAAGDCIGDPMYVYVSAYAGELAAENALTGAGWVYDLSALPHVVFTDPQVASVGLTEAAARAQGKRVKTSVLHLKDVPRALASRDTRGLFKLVAEEETDKLLGAHVLADQAGEVIQSATLAVKFGLRVQDLVETFHPYLTMVEGLKLAALTFEKDVAKLSCCAA